VQRPVIGIATQTLEAIPGQVPRAWVMGQTYIRVLTAAGAVPWLIPLLPDDEPTLRAVFERLDGLFLTGGVDVDPSRYREERQPICGVSDTARDAVELMMVRWAMAEHKPVLGVCRGHQVINVAAGGALYQDVTAQRSQCMKHDYFPHTGPYTRDQIVHDVAVTPGSRLDSIVGLRTLRVNSMHHQGVKVLGSGLTASAHAPDGLIEGLEGSNGQFLIGVQWHPEELTRTDPAMERLFSTFLDAARTHQIRS
jgi:putative glutamine amidotransferase